MTPIMMSIIVGTSFVVTSFKTFDGVVYDNYYKDGKAYTVRYEEDRAAVAKQLQATLVAVDNSIRVQLGGELSRYPEVMNLIFIYPSTDEFDIRLDAIHQGSGVYTAQLGEYKPSYYLMQFYTKEDADIAFRLHGESSLPLSAPVVLKPKIR